MPSPFRRTRAERIVRWALVILAIVVLVTSVANVVAELAGAEPVVPTGFTLPLLLLVLLSGVLMARRRQKPK